MTACAKDYWDRANKALAVARNNLSLDSDAAASRAYYAAFYAVSAHFALENVAFSRHTAVEAAVHHDLVRSGIWPTELGAAYTRLLQLRAWGDYGGNRHVSPADAEEAVCLAADILRAVADAHPEHFTGPETG